MRKTSGNKIKYLKYGLIAVLSVFLILGLFLLLKGWEKRHSFFPSREISEETLTYKGGEYVLKDNIETFLVLGLDKFDGDFVNDSYNNDQCADFLMLFVFDNNTKKCSAVHVNRDTMAQVNVLGVAGNRVDTVTRQISLAHTYGQGGDVSCRNTADAVSKLLMNVKVNHYISFTLDSVTVMNDLVGGVEVVVSDDFSEIDETLVQGETITLTGEQAMSFVRTRYGLEDSSNSTRMKRQQQYITALYEKYTECVENDEDFIVESTLAMSDYIVSDRSVTQLQELSRKFSEYEFVGIDDFDGELTLGEEFMEFYPDEDSVLEIVVDSFYEIKD